MKHGDRYLESAAEKGADIIDSLGIRPPTLDEVLADKGVGDVTRRMMADFVDRTVREVDDARLQSAKDAYNRGKRGIDVIGVIPLDTIDEVVAVIQWAKIEDIELPYLTASPNLHAELERVMCGPGEVLAKDAKVTFLGVRLRWSE